MAKTMDAYYARPGATFELDKIAPTDSRYFSGDKKDAAKVLEKLNRDLEALQEILYAEHKHKVLIVLQAMDTGGKDGVIRHVFDGVNPQGVRVASFKAPTPEELDHDYLWRVHKHTPARGEMVIFNRSHYEDVLVVRVHNLVPENIWSRRYAHINAFERMLSEEGTSILKFYLHISKEEQKARLEERRDDPQKRWKFNPDDLKERALWGEYQKAYQDMINATSTRWAPWYVVPADRKWYRNFVIGTLLVDQLKALQMSYPAVSEEVTQIEIT